MDFLLSCSLCKSRLEISNVSRMFNFDLKCSSCLHEEYNIPVKSIINKIKEKLKEDYKENKIEEKLEYSKEETNKRNKENENILQKQQILIENQRKFNNLLNTFEDAFKKTKETYNDFSELLEIIKNLIPSIKNKKDVINLQKIYNYNKLNQKSEIMISLLNNTVTDLKNILINNIKSLDFRSYFTSKENAELRKDTSILPIEKNSSLINPEIKSSVIISPDLLISKIIPKLTNDTKKMDLGRSCVVGGNVKCVRGVFLSAIASIKCGSYDAMIYTDKNAKSIIQNFSPEVVVREGFNTEINAENYYKNITEYKQLNEIKSFSSIVFGTGFDYFPNSKNVAIWLLNEITRYNVPIIFESFNCLINEFKNIKLNFISDPFIILTPDQKEYSKLLETFLKDKISTVNKDLDFKNIEGDILLFEKENFERIKPYFINQINLSKVFACESESEIFNKILVKKGKYDLITNGERLYIIKNEGSLNRVPGLGDILTGFINSYCGMVYAKIKGINSNDKNLVKTEKTLDQNILMECCALGCYFSRKAALSAFKKKKYSMTAFDVINEIPSILTYNY